MNPILKNVANTCNNYNFGKEKWWLNNQRDAYDIINEYAINNGIRDLKIHIKFWHALYDVKEIPKCECGNHLKFNTFVYGYSSYCSRECSYKSEKLKQRIKQTNLEKYGVENVFQNTNVINKIKQTNLEKYGVENISQSADSQLKKKKNNFKKYGKEHVFQVDCVKEKRKKTVLEKYGVEQPSQNKSIADKIKHTTLKRYGSEYYIHSNEHKIKTQVKRLSKLKSEFRDIDFLNTDDANALIIKGDCHTYSINMKLLRLRYYNHHKICTICNNPVQNSTSEFHRNVLSFIKEHYNDQIILNDKKTISPLELDIYLPNLKIAIECNGVYWHNEIFKEKNYHQKKFKACFNNEIKLIQIWEDDWLYKNEIIKSRILNVLNKNNTKIYARKCAMVDISSKKANEFYEKNHLQGKINSKQNIGLFFENELVSVMSFGKLRKNLNTKHIENSFELLRFCNKLNHTVIGAGGKMLKYFIEKNNPIQIISYADLNWGVGFYEKIGFSFESFTGVGYWWLVNGIKENRFKYRKNVLVKKGHDENLTEEEIMYSLGHTKIWNAGNAKYVWQKKI